MSKLSGKNAMTKLKLMIWTALALMLAAWPSLIVLAEGEVTEAAEGGPSGVGTLMLFVGLAAIVIIGGAFYARDRSQRNQGSPE